MYFLLKSNTIIHNKTDKVSFDTIFNIYMSRTGLAIIPEPKGTYAYHGGTFKATAF